MKKVVWLLGDSIRMYYQDLVIKKLGEDYDIYKPEENCRFSTYTLNSLRWWTPHWPKPDIIHWNNGLWDIKQCFPEEKNFTTPERYIEDMGRILRELRKSGAKIIFALTTPTLHDLKEDSEKTISNADVRYYNELFLKYYMDKVDAIDDLFSVVNADLEKYICEDYLHLSEAGKEVCSDAVVKAIKMM